MIGVYLFIGAVFIILGMLTLTVSVFGVFTIKRWGKDISQSTKVIALTLLSIASAIMFYIAGLALMKAINQLWYV